MPKSTKQGRAGKSDRPGKPYPEFPLYAHPLGYWSKRVNGQIKHFGRWGRVVDGKLTPLPYEQSWQEALRVFKARVDDLMTGRTSDAPVVRPVEVTERLTIMELCNHFLDAKFQIQSAGEIEPCTYDEYKAATDRLIKFFKKHRRVETLHPTDFQALRQDLAKSFGPTRLAKFIQLIRTIFNYASAYKLIGRRLDFGPDFKKPSQKVMRKVRVDRGKKLFTAEEIRQMLDGKMMHDANGKVKELPGASTQLRAMVLLGINCGFGNMDCADLPRSAIDFEQGWIDFPRPKTGVERRCPIWPETAESLRAAIAVRPKPKGRHDADLVFLTKYGNRWVRRGTLDDERNVTKSDNALAHKFGDLLRDLGINGRYRLGFYSLRHTFRTVADATKDFPAARLIMGHADNSIDAEYRENIDDERLLAISEHVRTWLFPEQQKVKEQALIREIEEAGGEIKWKERSPISTREPDDPIYVVYDRHGKRVRRKVDDPYKARRFYLCKDIEGRNPKVMACSSSMASTTLVRSRSRHRSPTGVRGYSVPTPTA